MEHKTLALELKADEPGSVRAVFSTLNVIDKDGDVTLPGAFGEQMVNIAAWGHNWGDLPSGDGKISEQGTDAIFAGSFYLGTPQGDTTYQTLKQRFDRGVVAQEWSYGFSVLESDFGKFLGQDVRFLKKLKVFEVSPVMVGAGENTRTLDMKGMTYQDHGDEVLAALSAYVERSKELAALRAKEGRLLSAANRERLVSLAETVRKSLTELEGLLDATDPGKGQRLVDQAFLAYQQFLFTRTAKAAV